MPMEYQSRRPLAAALLGVLLATGIALGGYLVGDGLYRARAAERVVTVKGLSEREVEADLAIWPVVFNVTGDELGRVQVEVEEKLGLIRDYLRQRGFQPDELSTSVPRITDLHAQMAGAPNLPEHRYLAEATLVLRTGKVDALKNAMQDSGTLVGQGVALVRSYEYQPQFIFTGLEAIKPEMIAEATRDARRAAAQFAQDSGSRVGAIRSAQQGYFSVSDRDPFSPEFKTIRVVTTVEYFLVD